MDLMTRSANAVVHSRLKALSEETGEQPYDLALSELRYYATALQTTREALADSLARSGHTLAGRPRPRPRAGVVVSSQMTSEMINELADQVLAELGYEDLDKCADEFAARIPEDELRDVVRR